MDGKVATAPVGRPFPRGLLGSLPAEAAGAVAAAAGDVAMVIDREGVIRDLALSSDDLEREGADAWLDRRWLDTVTVESRPKVDALLRDAARAGRPRWREINQVTAANRSTMVRFVAVATGEDGQVIAIGRDERAASALQQRLVEAQQSLERDYARLREAEGRYRLLFRVSAEPVLVVDAQTRRVIEANPAAERLFGEGRPKLVGAVFSTLFDAESREEAASLMAVAQSSAGAQPAQASVAHRGRTLVVSASLFRQERQTYALVRLTRTDGEPSGERAEGPDLHAVVDRIPDGFLVADANMGVITANSAFLDLVGVGSLAQLVGRPVGEVLGRAGRDRNILLDALREHGFVRNFRTLLHADHGGAEDVEVSATAAPDGGGTVYGFAVRGVDRRFNERPHAAPELRRSVEQLTELVGRMTLKDLVRETTDLVERLCIEAALELTKNNRASAAEILGLSRQSLYSKLHRFGLGNLAGDAP